MSISLVLHTDTAWIAMIESVTAKTIVLKEALYPAWKESVNLFSLLYEPVSQ
jgi:hypothetical protein